LFALRPLTLAENRSITVEKRRIENEPSHVRKFDSDFARQKRRGRHADAAFLKEFPACVLCAALLSGLYFLIDDDFFW